jgi:hypothetical protein
VTQPVAGGPLWSAGAPIELIEHVPGIGQGSQSAGIADASELGFELVVGHGSLQKRDGMGRIWSVRVHLQYDVENWAVFTAFLKGVTSTARCVTSIQCNKHEGF